MATQQNEKVVTPIGVSQYAWLTQPDTRFDESGHYKTNLILKTEEAGELMQRIDKALEVSRELAQEKAKGKKVKQADAPYFEEVDDAGNSTGNTIFKFKCKAQIVSKDGTIIPNNQLGSNEVTINFNITATDASSFDDLLVERRDTIVGVINEALNENGKRSLIQ